MFTRAISPVIQQNMREYPSVTLFGPLGNLFENIVVIEAAKKCANEGFPPELYFFRNSNGLEIDLIKERRGILDIFEIKSGKALDKNYTRAMHNFRKKYPETQGTDIAGTVIYSGEDTPAFNSCRFTHYTNTATLFSHAEEKFRLKF